MADTLSTERVDQHGNSRRRQGVDKVVFGVAAGLALVFLLYGALDSEGFGETGGSVLTWITTNFGWFFVLTSGAFLLFSVFLAATRYGNIKLGADDSVPEFSTFSWVSMMFATGMGIGLMFYGVAEPLTHLNAPPMGMAEPGSEEAAHLAMEYTFFHWGFHPWSMYAVIGLRSPTSPTARVRGNLISAAFRPLLGDRVDGPAGQGIDILAILATLFGSATSLGLGALQITGGLANVFGNDGYGTAAALVRRSISAVIAVLTVCFVISRRQLPHPPGVDKGIKWLVGWCSRSSSSRSSSSPGPTRPPSSWGCSARTVPRSPSEGSSSSGVSRPGPSPRSCCSPTGCPRCRPA
jgi:glycine betaine transporter